MRIDVDELDDYLMDFCGTAAMGGDLSAMATLQEVEDASGEELCEIAEDLGIDLEQFRAE